jgi:hypothetical protein
MGGCGVTGSRCKGKVVVNAARSARQRHQPLHMSGKVLAFPKRALRTISYPAFQPTLIARLLCGYFKAAALMQQARPLIYVARSCFQRVLAVIPDLVAYVHTTAIDFRDRVWTSETIRRSRHGFQAYAGLTNRSLFEGARRRFEINRYR